VAQVVTCCSFDTSFETSGAEHVAVSQRDVSLGSNRC